MAAGLTQEIWDVEQILRTIPIANYTATLIPNTTDLRGVMLSGNSAETFAQGR